MFRLIIALGVAAVLLPAETLTEAEKIETAEVSPQVSTYDAFNAAHSLYADVTSFCERNEETCITGKALATKAVKTISSSLKQLADGSAHDPAKQELDLTQTGTIQK